MIIIDGSYGEGGGQILRTSLALSLVTGKPFCIKNIRAGRKKPGLMRQHLTAANAAAEIGQAEIRGNQMGSLELSFVPSKVLAGCYHFSIGTAGSCTLVLQTVLPALLLLNEPSSLVLEGGTHNMYAPPFDFLCHAFLPVLNQMGTDIQAILERPGFYPAGGGKMSVFIQPAKELKRIYLRDRGKLLSKKAYSIVSKLPISIAHRELKVVQEKLGWEQNALEATEIADAIGQGNILTIQLKYQCITEIFTGFGERGVSAEQVANKTVHRVKEYLSVNVPVGKYLADQLMIPMALSGGGEYLTLSPTLHTTTNAEVIKKFLDIDITIDPAGENAFRVTLVS
ncbi:MAG: RNA 3'-terminal phosphate cyclase [Desulfobacterales bacterium]|nr:RNA 3'-terminal phosphate cyclase [Desulfobacterales bacterium]